MARKIKLLLLLLSLLVKCDMLLTPRSYGSHTKKLWFFAAKTMSFFL